MKSFGVFMFVTIQEFSYMFLMSWKHCNIILMVEKTVSNWSSNSSCSTENNARFHRVYIYIVLRTRRHKYPSGRARCRCIPGKERRIFYAFWTDLAISYQSKLLEITTPIKRQLYHVLLIGKGWLVISESHILTASCRALPELLSGSDVRRCSYAHVQSDIPARENRKKMDKNINLWICVFYISDPCSQLACFELMQPIRVAAANMRAA